jgi:hypothetical protein
VAIRDQEIQVLCARIDDQCAGTTKRSSVMVEAFGEDLQPVCIDRHGISSIGLLEARNRKQTRV